MICNEQLHCSLTAIVVVPVSDLHLTLPFNLKPLCQMASGRSCRHRSRQTRQSMSVMMRLLKMSVEERPLRIVSHCIKRL